MNQPTSPIIPAQRNSPNQPERRPDCDARIERRFAGDRRVLVQLFGQRGSDRPRPVLGLLAQVAYGNDAIFEQFRRTRSDRSPTGWRVAASAHVFRGKRDTRFGVLKDSSRFIVRLRRTLLLS